MLLPIEDSTTKLENVFEIQHSRGIVEANFGLKFQKINIDFQKCLLLLARVCPDVSHKADYSPDNKRYIQVFHKRELKRNKCDRVTMPFPSVHLSFYYIREIDVQSMRR